MGRCYSCEQTTNGNCGLHNVDFNEGLRSEQAATPEYVKEIEKNLAYLKANEIPFEFSWEKAVKEKQELLDRIDRLESKVASLEFRLKLSKLAIESLGEESNELQSVSNEHVGSKRRSRGSRSHAKKRGATRGKGKTRKGSK